MNKSTEAQEQAALIEWAGYNVGKYPELELLHHVPNERKDKIERMRLMQQNPKEGL
jgi:hypothetical protein